MGRSQGGTAPGPQPQRGPTNATDCGSDPLLMAGGGQSRATGHQTLCIVHWNAEGVRQKKLELQQFLKVQKIDVCCIQETHLNNTHRFSIRGYEIHRVDRADRPKGGVLTLVKTSIPSTEVQRSEKADMEYITVKLIFPDRNLTICYLYSQPNKAINLQILQPNSEDWMIVGDSNSHSPSWGYPSINAKGEEVEQWIASNRLVLINTPTDPPTFYSRVWKTTSTPDIAIATDNIQKIAKREVSEQLGGSDHKPVILTLAKQVNTNAGKMPPSWNYKKVDWKRFRELTDIYTKSITFSKHSVNKNASNFNSAVLKAAKESIPRGRRHDYKPYWNNTLEKIHKELSEAREEMERNPTPQNVRRHSQLKVDLDKEQQTQAQASWKTKTASLNMERETQNSGSWQSRWMETTQSGAEQHCKPQMELSQERRQQMSLPESLKKRAQLHPQLTESKMSGPRHGLCSKTQLLLALTHVWLNAWPSESLKKRWKRWSRRRLQDLMESQMKCWNTSAQGQSVPYCASTIKAGRQVSYQQSGRKLS